MDQEQETPASPDRNFALTFSRGFPEWLARVHASLAFTTYQAGKLFLIGLKPDGRVSLFERTFARCMGMGVAPGARHFFLATQFQLYRFDNVLPAGTRRDEYDAMFVPNLAWITGDLDVHDVAVDGGGRPVFVNTLFSCVATVSDGYSFRPLWRPPFVSALVPEDRCHLNGLAMADGRPRYVTLVGRSDIADGWREHRAGGGLLYDIASDAVVVDGLSMPHSPRLHDGKLWLLNSGTGELGFVHGDSRRFVPIAFCPGYARGLAFVGRYAVIGLSLARENRTFHGLPLDGALLSHQAEPHCGLLVVDATNGETIAWVKIEGLVRELFDVSILEGVRNPSAIGLRSNEIHRIVSIDPA